MERLQDKAAIITGSGSGIGAAIAAKFAAEGAIVIVADLNASGAAKVAEQIEADGGRAKPYTIDVTDRRALADFMKAVNEDFGRIDILVNNAGITRYRPFLEANDEDWNLVLNLDLKAVFFCIQAAAPYFTDQKFGRVVNISSSLGTATSPHATAGSPGGSAAYGSAKAGVILLTKTMARELGPHNVTVNCVAPGTFLTPMTGAARSAEEVAEHMEARKKMNVMGRLGTMDELTEGVLFLASDEASFITGHTLPIDGGRTDRM